MSDRKEVRAAISALLDAGENPTAVAAALNVARTTVYRVKKKESGQNPVLARKPARPRPILTPRVLGGSKRGSARRRESP